MAFYSSKICEFPVEPNSAISAHETVILKQDRDFWAKQWDVDGIKQFVRATMPEFENLETNTTIADKFKELEHEVGGKGSVRKISWPVALILASKK